MKERYLHGVGKLLVGLGVVGGIAYCVFNESGRDTELQGLLKEKYPIFCKFRKAGFDESSAVSLVSDDVSFDDALEWFDSGIPAEYQSCYIDNGLDKGRAKLIYDGLGKYSSHHNVSVYVNLSEDDIRNCMGSGFIGHYQMIYVNSNLRENDSVDIETAKKWRSMFSPQETKKLTGKGVTFEQAREAIEQTGVVTVESILKYCVNSKE